MTTEDYTIEQNEQGEYVIRRPDGIPAFTLAATDDTFARELLENLNCGVLEEVPA